MSANRNPAESAVPVESQSITIPFLRSYPALQPKSDDQLLEIVAKLKNEWIDTTADLNRVSRDSLAAKLPALALDALKPPLQQHGMEQQRNETAPNILGPGVYEKLTASVFFLRDAKGTAIGTGYILSSDIALTVAHNFPDGTAEGTEVLGCFGRPHQNKTCEFRVDLIDFNFDVCVLARHGGEPFSVFLNPSLESLVPGKECILAAFQIGLQEDLNDLDTQHSVGIFRGNISKAHPRHFVYDCPTFAGDSGGAIIFYNGNAFGVHVETVNQARERRRLQSLEDNKSTKNIVAHLEEVEASVDSLISSLSSGALGISVSSILAEYESRKITAKK